LTDPRLLKDKIIKRPRRDPNLILDPTFQLTTAEVEALAKSMREREKAAEKQSEATTLATAEETDRIDQALRKADQMRREAGESGGLVLEDVTGK
jgi:hypothetical protein